MTRLKLYLDNCCFNRPFDNQTQLKIKLETEAKLAIQAGIKRGDFELGWSYILDFENDNNPQIERIIEIEKWKAIASFDVIENDNILLKMNNLVKLGLKPLDSLHLSCAIDSECDYFLTVDKGVIKKSHLVSDIKIITPIDFVMKMEENHD
jgi:hypothetical protein